MFAVRDNQTGKFLRSFNGSLNHAFMYQGFDLEDELGRQATFDEIWEKMFCLDTPNGAKIYKSESGIRNSLGDNWLAKCSIIKIKIIYACED